VRVHPHSPHNEENSFQATARARSRRSIDERYPLQSTVLHIF